MGHAHMFSLLPDNVLAIFLGCMHHQLGLVLTPVTKELSMLCPAFCTAKQMQNEQSETINGITADLYQEYHDQEPSAIRVAPDEIKSRDITVCQINRG